MWTFWARTDSNSANNPALNLTGDPATLITFVASGANGDLSLDTNGGAPDPDTQVEIGGQTYDFTFQLSAELPTQKRDGAGQVPDQYEGSPVYIITVHDYPAAGQSMRLAFMPEENATQADMDAFGNGAIDLQNTGTEPTPDYVVEGTSGDDVIDATYSGDLEGDRIDNNDGNPLQPGVAGGDNDSVTAGDGNDYVASGAGDDTVLGESGNDHIDGGAGNDFLVGGQGADTLLGGTGNDTIEGGTNEATGIGGSSTVGSTYTVISLGSAADVDPSEFNGAAENAADLLGTYGGAGSELYNNFATMVANDANGNGTLDDNDFGAAPESFTIEGVTYAIDSVMVYNATVTFTDGSSGPFTAVVFQTTTGEVFMAPEFSANADSALLTSQPIRSITLDSVSVDDTLLYADRLDADYQVPVEDLSGDSIDGGQGDDLIFGGGGDDTIALSDGFGADTIIGGETGEINGDTLDMSAVTTGVQLDLTSADPEAGSVSEAGSTGDPATFTEIETIVLSGGRDSVMLGDGGGLDAVTGFDISDAGDGTAIDRLDVSGLTSDGSTPVTTNDVTVSSDPYGNAVLTFPGGESITLAGVNPLNLSTVDSLVAIGIPDGRDFIVEGTSGDDIIDAGYTGDPERDFVDAGDAPDGSDDDVIEAGAGNDSVVAGAGDDSVLGDIGNDTLEGGAGNDTMRGGEGADSLDGGAGDDSLFGDEGDDTILGGDGADTIDGGIGNDSIDGGDGNDSISGHDGDDTIHGGAGDDWLRGSVGNDELWGGTGDDYIWAGFNDDTIRIENNFGNDTIEGEGIDETTGDVLDLSLVTDDLIIDLTGSNPEQGTFSDGISTAQFNEIENIILGAGRDTIVLADFGGADLVRAFDMTDSGDGTTMDQLDVSGLTSDWGTTPVHAGDVTVTDDGNGNAVLSFPGGESITLVGVAPGQLATVDDLVSIGIPDGRDFIVEGSAGDDIIDAGYAGDPEGDRIDAGDHSDGSDADSVEAGAGDDLIAAGVGDDTVHGGAGDDTVRLEDGFGNDQLTGGETGESNGDTLDLSNLTVDTIIDLTNVNQETVTVSDGTDTVTAEEFETLVLGGGEDTLLLGDGGGSDVVSGFDMGDRGDGHSFDQLDVTGLTTDGITPVTAWDVVVTDTNGDGTGDAILTFPGGESITLEGVLSSQVNTIPELFAIGIPCFTPGAMIVTEVGEKPVEQIRPGDRVLTADNGFQPVRWVGSRTLDAADLAARPELKPVVIRKHAFGNTRKMLVSPQHGFVMKTDAGERLIRAKHAAELFGGQVARIDRNCEAVTYVHIMFDRHEIVFAEGARTEAFYPGPQALTSVEREAMTELLALFPELARVAFGDATPSDCYGPPARDYLLGRDIRAMARAMAGSAT